MQVVDPLPEPVCTDTAAVLRPAQVGRLSLCLPASPACTAAVAPTTAPTKTLRPAVLAAAPPRPPPPATLVMTSPWCTAGTARWKGVGGGGRPQWRCTWLFGCGAGAECGPSPSAPPSSLQTSLIMESPRRPAAGRGGQGLSGPSTGRGVGAVGLRNSGARQPLVGLVVGLLVRTATTRMRRSLAAASACLAAAAAICRGAGPALIRLAG